MKDKINEVIKHHSGEFENLIEKLADVIETENGYLSKVKDFHSIGNLTINKSPTIMSSKDVNLKVTLIKEETTELYKAYVNNDLIEQLDAYCDLMYVLCGSIISSGMTSIFSKAFAEVHRSNMTKMILENQIEYEISLKQENITIIPATNYKGYFCMFNDDGKLIKPSTYSPANLKPFIEENLKI